MIHFVEESRGPLKQMKPMTVKKTNQSHKTDSYNRIRESIDTSTFKQTQTEGTTDTQKKKKTLLS